MWPLLAFAIVLAIVIVVLRGPPLLAKLSVRRGSVRLSRGRLPARLLADFEDVLTDQAIQNAEVRIIVEGGRARLLAEGLDDGREQQLRNVLGPYTVAQIRAGRRAAGGQKP